MKDMTLREVCNAADVSRRAVQGYEKAGLVSASGRSERGYLLYNVDAQNRIKRIKFFQQLGFTIKEIKAIIDAPNGILKAALEDRVERLKEERMCIECLINETYELIENL